MSTVLDEPHARVLAEGAFPNAEVVLGEGRELAAGWFFPCVTKGVDFADGVIVNKETGKRLIVLADGQLARDLSLYDRGYQFELYDLVVVAVDNVEETVRTIAAVRPMASDVYYRYDRVWRVGRGMTESEIRERIATLPAIFSGRLDGVLEDLETARREGWFEFKALEYRGEE